MAAKQHQQATQDFDAIAHQHDPTLWKGVCVSAYKRRQHHVKQGKHGYQGRLLPFRGLGATQQLHCAHKQGVVSQRAEKLRRHDGEKTAFHQ